VIKTVIWTLGHGVKVVEAERSTASPKAGEDQNWIEYQVKQGRRIISRHDRRRVAYEVAQAYVKAMTP
jgi:hypothetical protein